MSIYNIYNEDCSSCRSYITVSKYGDQLCNKLNEPEAIDCPCAKCLVKSMCEQGCPEYYDFWNAKIKRDINRARSGDLG